MGKRANSGTSSGYLFDVLFISANLNSMKQNLEKEFLKLPTLNHVGMALLQFLLSISNQKVSKNAFGVYEMWFVSFSFPKGEERIRMLVNLKIEKVNAIDKRWLPLEKTEGEFFACEIKHAGQLGQAIRYIEYGREKNMTTRQIPSDTAPLN